MADFNPDWCGSGRMYHFDSITSDVDDECEYLIIDRALEF
jgi:hypothetical protein